MQLELPGLPPQPAGGALRAELEAAIEHGELVPGCAYCQQIYDRALTFGYRIGPRHRSFFGHRAHCTCKGCF